MTIEKKHRCGTRIIAAVDIKTPKGDLFMTAGEEGQIMVIDPSKGEEMYGIRKADGNNILYTYVKAEAVQPDVRFPLPMG